MRLPDHIATMFALARAGTPLHLVMSKAEIPATFGDQLVLIGDDLAEGLGLGPAGWDSPALRRLLRSLNPGAIGLFAGAPLASAYEALCFSAAMLPGGALIVECSTAQFEAWYAYTKKHAVFASRFDVAPHGWLPPPDTLLLRGVC